MDLPLHFCDKVFRAYDVSDATEVMFCLKFYEHNYSMATIRDDLGCGWLHERHQGNVKTKPNNNLKLPNNDMLNTCSGIESKLTN